MTRTAQFLQPHPVRLNLKKLFDNVLGGVLVGAAALTAPAAHAAAITFEGYANILVGSEEHPFDQSGIRLTALSNAAEGLPGDLVGAVIDGTDLAACGNLACPANNSSSFYVALNDSVLYLDPLHAGQTIKIGGFDASFVGSVQGVSYPAVAGLLRIQGFYADGASVYETYQLGGPIGGSFQFQHFDTTAAFGSQAFSSVTIFGFTCNLTGNCNAFNSNKGQFALDNLVVSVPEPSTSLMLLSGLAGIGAVARRRRRNT